MKPIHTAGDFTNISYIQSSEYLYGHIFTYHAQLKEDKNRRRSCLYVTAVSRIRRIFVVKDMQQTFGR